ncbi:MAG: hypothetical protein QOK00_3558 [Thermoleophilaceae bacterium]|nr:hypothetical protein [Thermoleophilaceae bacterium]
MEHDERAEELEREAEVLEQHAERVGEHIEDARRDWEAKEDDPTVPGAQPDPGDEEESLPGVGSDEETLSEEGGP